MEQLAKFRNISVVQRHREVMAEQAYRGLVWDPVLQANASLHLPAMGGPSRQSFMRCISGHLFGVVMFDNNPDDLHDGCVVLCWDFTDGCFDWHPEITKAVTRCAWPSLSKLVNSLNPASFMPNYVPVSPMRGAIALPKSNSTPLAEDRMKLMQRIFDNIDGGIVAQGNKLSEGLLAADGGYDIANVNAKARHIEPYTAEQDFGDWVFDCFLEWPQMQFNEWGYAKSVTFNGETRHYSMNNYFPWLSAA